MDLMILLTTETQMDTLSLVIHTQKFMAREKAAVLVSREEYPKTLVQNCS